MQHENSSNANIKEESKSEIQPSDNDGVSSPGGNNSERYEINRDAQSKGNPLLDSSKSIKERGKPLQQTLKKIF